MHLGFYYAVGMDNSELMEYLSEIKEIIISEITLKRLLKKSLTAPTHILI